jgi:hypothetical protein
MVEGACQQAPNPTGDVSAVSGKLVYDISLVVHPPPCSEYAERRLACRLPCDTLKVASVA